MAVVQARIDNGNSDVRVAVVPCAAGETIRPHGARPAVCRPRIEVKRRGFRLLHHDQRGAHQPGQTVHHLQRRQAVPTVRHALVDIGDLAAESEEGVDLRLRNALPKDQFNVHHLAERGLRRLLRRGGNGQLGCHSGCGNAFFEAVVEAVAILIAGVGNANERLHPRLRRRRWSLRQDGCGEGEKEQR